MADNLKYAEPGSGPLVATDDVGSTHYQVVKLNIGNDGVSIPVDGKIPVTVVSGSITAIIGGDIAHDSPDSGNPSKIGGKGYGALPTAVTANDRVNAYFDREGRQIVRPWGASEWSQVHLAEINTRATTTKSAGGSDVRHVCTGMTVIFAANSTAPAATVTDVRLRDGASDTGTILWQAKISLPAVAGAMNGVTRSGLHIKGTAATAMTLEFSGTGVANAYQSVSIEGIDIIEA